MRAANFGVRFDSPTSISTGMEILLNELGANCAQTLIRGALSIKSPSFLSSACNENRFRHQNYVCLILYLPPHQHCPMLLPGAEHFKGTNSPAVADIPDYISLRGHLITKLAFQFKRQFNIVCQSRLYPSIYISTSL